MNLPVGEYIPPRSRGRADSGPTRRQPQPPPPPPPPQAEKKFVVEEQGPSEYPPAYLQVEARRFMHKVAPMVPTGLSGTNFGSYKQAETSNGYHILWQNMLGKGGFGYVYKGYKRNPRNPKRIINYAIKVINREIQGQLGGQKIKELVNEISNWEHCSGNMFIVRLVDHFAVQNQYCFVMEWATHGDFVNELDKMPNNRFNQYQARYYFKQMVGGVNYMHARGIAHRDIKLQNFLLCADPRDKDKKICKISDFGLSAVAWTLNEGPIRQNNACGTVRYMPPEILMQRAGLPKPLKQPPEPDDALEDTTPRKPPVIPTTAARIFRGQETLRPPSVPIAYRDYITWKTFAVNNDSWALGITLYVMTNGGYPFFYGDLPHGLDIIMKAKFVKPKIMPQNTREFIRTMLEPNPNKRANTRDLLYHDWMFDNPVGRKGRTSPDPDLSTVPPPFEPPPAPEPSDDEYVSAPLGPSEPKEAADSSAPFPLRRVRAGAMVYETPTPGSPKKSDGAESDASGNSQMSSSIPAPPPSAASAASGSPIILNPQSISRGFERGGRFVVGGSSSSGSEGKGSAGPAKVSSPPGKKVQFKMGGPGGGSSSSSDPHEPEQLKQERGRARERTISREARAKFFAGGSASSDAVAKELKKLSSSEKRSESPKIKFQMGGSSSSDEVKTRPESSSAGARAMFFAGGGSSSPDPKVKELKKLSSSEKRSESPKIKFKMGGSSSSDEEKSRPKSSSGGARAMFFAGGGSSSSSPAPSDEVVKKVAAARRESADERRRRHEEQHEKMFQSVTWTPAYPGQPDPYAGVEFPVLSDISGSSAEGAAAAKHSSSSGAYETASETEPTAPTTPGSTHPLLARSRAGSPRRSPTPDKSKSK